MLARGRQVRQGDAYKVSGGLHGVGVSVVNALSETASMLEVWRDGKVYQQTFERGKPESDLVVDRHHQAAGHQGHLQARPGDLRDHRVQLRHAGQPPARAGVPQRRRHHHARRRARGRQESQVPLRGRHRRVRRASQPATRPSSTTSRSTSRGEKDRHRRRDRDAVQRRLQRERLLLRQQHQHHRRRHAPLGFPRRADAHDQQLRRARTICSKD